MALSIFFFDIIVWCQIFKFLTSNRIELGSLDFRPSDFIGIDYQPSRLNKPNRQQLDDQTIILILDGVQKIQRHLLYWRNPRATMRYSPMLCSEMKLEKTRKSVDSKPADFEAGT